MAQEENKTIIIIDDEKSFCELFSFALKKEGFKVIYYTDPQEALSKIIEVKADLILLDLAMPVLNGFDVLTHLKNELGQKLPPILILTNLEYTPSGIKIDDNYALSIGTLGIIHKTSDLDKMINKIKSFFKT